MHGICQARGPFGRLYEAEEVETWEDRATTYIDQVHVHVCFQRASILRDGANQAVRLPQESRFPEEVKEIRIRKQGDRLLISPVRPD